MLDIYHVRYYMISITYNTISCDNIILSDKQAHADMIFHIQV